MTNDDSQDFERSQKIKESLALFDRESVALLVLRGFRNFKLIVLVFNIWVFTHHSNWWRFILVKIVGHGRIGFIVNWSVNVILYRFTPHHFALFSKNKDSWVMSLKLKNIIRSIYHGDYWIVNIMVVCLIKNPQLKSDKWCKIAFIMNCKRFVREALPIK